MVSRFMGGPGRKAFDGITWADAKVLDGAVLGTGTLVRKMSGIARKSQSGFVRVYAATIVLAVFVMLAWFVWRGVA